MDMTCITHNNITVSLIYVIWTYFLVNLDNIKILGKLIN